MSIQYKQNNKVERQHAINQQKDSIKTAANPRAGARLMEVLEVLHWLSMAPPTDTIGSIIATGAEYQRSVQLGGSLMEVDTQSPILYCLTALDCSGSQAAMGASAGKGDNLEKVGELSPTICIPVLG